MPKSLILDETDLNFLVHGMSLFRNNIKELCADDPDVEGMFRLDENLRTAQSKAYTALDGGTDEPFTDAELAAADRALCVVRAKIKQLLPDEDLETWAANSAGWRQVHGLIMRHIAASLSG